MKKILSLIVALVIFTGMADAQISIKKSDYKTAQQVTTLSMYWTWIYKQGDTYFLVMKSDNEFDDAFWMQIGKTKSECLESIAALQELCETIGDSDMFELDNGLNQTFEVTQYKALGMIGLKFHEKEHAGSASILNSILTKAAKWIQKNVE